MSLLRGGCCWCDVVNGTAEGENQTPGGKISVVAPGFTHPHPPLLVSTLYAPCISMGNPNLLITMRVVAQAGAASRPTAVASRAARAGW